jgi:hypothetical protein
MDNEEFYAIIKLVSGEEIISKVCSCEEDDRILLLLENPVIMEEVDILELGISIFKMKPWIKTSSDNLFFVDLDRVITMTETNDKDIISNYKRFIGSQYSTSNRVNPKEEKGYLNNVNDFRKLLERLYKISPKDL